MIVAQLESPIQQTIHIDLLANHLIGRRGFAFMNEVAPAKLVRSKAGDFSDFIQMPLERKDALRRSETSKSTVRRHVRRYSLTLDADIRAEVRAGSVDSSA